MINILLCGNQFDGMLTGMLSIFMRTKTKEAFHFYIYTMDVSDIKPNYVAISDEMASYLDLVAKSYNNENIVEKIDVLDIYNKEFRNSPNESAYCSPFTLIRLFADLVPNMPNKILYLDTDILFNRDITLIWNIDVTGYEYAAARDHYGKFLINPNYINAGVLLFNLAEMKRTGILEKARQLIRTKRLVFADQSAIIRSTTKRKVLPQKFNEQKFLHKKSTIIRHFSKRLFYFPYPKTKNIKQWDVEKMHKVYHYYVFDDILEEYIYLKKKFEKEVLKNGK